MTMGKRIAKLRNSRGLNQEKLAKELNVSPSTIAMWETDKRALKDESIIALANYFNVTADYLLNGDNGYIKQWNDSFDLATKEKDKIETIAAHIDDDVTDEQMDDILNYIDFIKHKHSKKD